MNNRHAGSPRQSGIVLAARHLDLAVDLQMVQGGLVVVAVLASVPFVVGIMALL